MRFSVHPEGARPPAASGGPAEEAQPVAGPLVLGYAEALRAHLEAWQAAKRGRITARGARREARRFAMAHFPWAWVEPGSGAFLSEAAGEGPAAAPERPGEAAGTGGDPLRNGSLLVASPPEVSVWAARLLSGRRLFSHELAKALSHRGVAVFGDLDLLLDPLVQQGDICRHPGVELVLEPGAPPAWRCRRCLSPRIGWHPCPRCRQDACPQCDDCRSLGASSACLALYERPHEERPEAAPPQVRVHLPFTLSPFQERVSWELAQTGDDVLIWAACGSGKTEVTLRAVSETVSRGGRVLFALPRRDVVDQLGQRLRDALPGAGVSTLRGGAEPGYGDAPVTVATVHQALRFCQRFDLVIVDEVDAYPLDQEAWLLAALERARRPGGRLVLMTATPPERIVARIGRAGGLRCLTLPGRPHGHPLPVPEVVTAPDLAVEGLWAASHGGKTPGWLGTLDRLARESLERGRRLLVFVPAVRLAGAVARMLCRTGPYFPWDARGGPAGPGRDGLRAPLGDRRERPECRGGRFAVAAVHAGDPCRTEKVAAFAAGKIDVLVSTSILERGVTFPGLDVVVLAADWERVYSARSLVQMAGRVGRSPKDPTGRVVFLARSGTPAMAEAIDTIRRFNEASRRVIQAGTVRPSPAKI